MNPVIYKNGTKSWLNEKSQLHRTDGPALEYPDGYKVWYLNGTELSEDLFLKITQGPAIDLPLYLGLGCDQYISERIKNEPSQI